MAFASLGYDTYFPVNMHLVACCSTTDDNQDPISLFPFTAKKTYLVLRSGRYSTISRYVFYEIYPVPLYIYPKPKLPYSLSYPLFNNLFLVLW